MKKYTARFIIFFVLLCSFAFYAPPAHAQQFSYNLSAAPGANPGQVTLTWTHLKAEVKNYNLLYGPENNKRQYGAVNIDGSASINKTVSYTVNYLVPGTNYFFTLVPVANGKATPLNFQVTSFPRAGVVVLPSAPTSNTSTSGPAVNTGLINSDSIKNQKGDIKSKNVGLHELSVSKGDRPGEVKLTWKHLEGETNYHIVYGNKRGELQYGALNVGNTTSFTIRALKPGETYYFAIAPVVNGRAQYITQQASQPIAQSNIGSNGGGGSNGNGGSQGSGSNGGGQGTTTNTTTNTSNTTSPASGTSNSGTSGSGSTGTTTTTTTTKDNNPKNNDNSGQDKKVRGAETSNDDTQENSKMTIWDLIKRLFSL